MRRTFRVILFAGVVVLMGLMIRSCNEQAGWFEANKIELNVEKPLDESKFRWYMAEPFDELDEYSIALPVKYQQLLYDTVLVKPFPRVEDRNYLVLEYDSVWIFPFIHPKYRKNTQHEYEFHLYLKDSVPYAEVTINGPYYEHQSGPFTSIKDSVARYQANREDDEHGEEYDEDFEEGVKEEDKRPADTLANPDYQPR